jgi:hypothetical protein
MTEPSPRPCIIRQLDFLDLGNGAQEILDIENPVENRGENSLT